METSRKDPRQICVRILSTQFYLSCCDKEKEEVLLLSLARGAIQALHCMVRRPSILLSAIAILEKRIKSHALLRRYTNRVVCCSARHQATDATRVKVVPIESLAASAKVQLFGGLSDAGLETAQANKRLQVCKLRD